MALIAEKEDRVFACRPNQLKLVAGAIFFGVGGVWMFWAGRTNREGLIVDGVIHLDPNGAMVFYLVVSLAAVAMAMFGVYALVRVSVNPHRIVVGAEGVTTPKWIWSASPDFIRYRDIRTVRLHEMRGVRYLRIYHADGTHAISQAMMGGESEFDAICGELKTRMREANGRHG
jgi:hypothetical protein